MSPSQHPAPITISEHFLADHQRLEALVARVLAAFSANDRELVAALWTEFDAGLLAHLEAEETYLIPVLLRTAERDARILLQEHKHMRTRLMELGVGIDLHLVNLEAAQSFMRELHAHATHEDALLYQRADLELQATERTSVFAALAASAKDKLTRLRAKTSGLA